MIEYLLTGPFGIISMTFKYLICMLTPLVTAFAFCQMFLERSGIILRLESHSGKLLSHMGLSADCLLPLMSGFGCTTAALSALSGLSSSRERYIAAFLLSAAVPCSAQTAVIIGIAFVLPPSLFIFYISSVAAVFVISGIFLNILLPADKIYHTPRTKNGAVHMPAMFPLLKVSVLYGISFLKDTLLPFAAGSAILSVLSYTGLSVPHMRACNRKLPAAAERSCVPVHNEHCKKRFRSGGTSVRNRAELIHIPAAYGFNAYSEPVCPLLCLPHNTSQTGGLRKGPVHMGGKPCTLYPGGKTCLSASYLLTLAPVFCKIYS